MITKKEQIKELKNEIEDLKYKLEYERELKNNYRTFWLDVKEMYKNK
jgi:hypothetical protein|tara:strand:- start:820 stop:960 length:141 start_codon:yes stop_codon:yes gene_type:complete